MVFGGLSRVRPVGLVIGLMVRVSQLLRKSAMEENGADRIVLHGTLTEMNCKIPAGITALRRDCVDRYAQPRDFTFFQQMPNEELKSTATPSSLVEYFTLSTAA